MSEASSHSSERSEPPGLVVERLLRRLDSLEAAVSSMRGNGDVADGGTSAGNYLSPLKERPPRPGRRASSLIMSVGENVQPATWRLDPLDTALGALKYGTTEDYKDLSSGFGRSLAMQDAVRAYLIAEDTRHLLSWVKAKPVIGESSDIDLTDSPGVHRLSGENKVDEWAYLLEAVLMNIGHVEVTEVSIDDCRRHWEECVQDPEERLVDFFHREEHLWRRLSEARSFHSLSQLADYDRLCGVMTRVSATVKDEASKWMRKHAVSASNIPFMEARDHMIEFEKKAEYRFPWETTRSVGTAAGTSPTSAEKRSKSAPSEVRNNSQKARGKKGNRNRSQKQGSEVQVEGPIDPRGKDIPLCPHCKRSTKTHSPEACWFRPAESSEQGFHGGQGGSTSAPQVAALGSSSTNGQPQQNQDSKGKNFQPSQRHARSEDASKQRSEKPAADSKHVTRSATGSLPPPINRYGENDDPPVFMVSGDREPQQPSPSLSHGVFEYKRFVSFKAKVPGQGRVQVIIDHASAFSLISDITALRLGCKIRIDGSSTRSVTAFGGQQVNLKGTCLLPVLIGGRKIFWRLQVVSAETCLAVDHVLLGLTALSSMGAVVSTPPSPAQPSIIFKVIQATVQANYECCLPRIPPKSHAYMPTTVSSLTAQDFLRWLDTATDKDMLARIEKNLEGFCWREACINFKEEDPIICTKPFRLKPEQLGALQEKIEAMVGSGVLQEVAYDSNHMHLSNCFVVKKQNGKYRMVTDLRCVN
ncbi:hypothetical protein FOZ62_015132 [Perkinsus olseni]|uniref:Uncharacterized protein n=1 Tax=Perkinsus olseni TaxID=32597 RepID=A0A7J6TU99_PEROL|nr:hypothetical protein FOZ62_015132 [Perkinsus olseni]